jgi:hypothetical protein
MRWATHPRMIAPHFSTVHRTRFVRASVHICIVRSARTTALPASHAPCASASVRWVVCEHIHQSKRSIDVRPAVLTAQHTTAVHCCNTQRHRCSALSQNRHSLTAIALAAVKARSITCAAVRQPVC